ncbi:phosphatase 2C-like domain-containing 1 [Pelobates cultripes]|uniref:Phosphatase 2C-like domain-containing 1 n=1 Tax=Pelobates cultripes TaxID=61616 RepID=A0AAD1RWU2_PELCU|nr:phosphatase 2C-like domain-containing 1 [Pelobates cultripes]
MRKESLLPNIAEVTNLNVQKDENKKLNRPDINEIWIPCSICHQHIHQNVFLNHKQLHKAFNLMGYKVADKPANIESLNSKKLQVISQKNKSSPCMLRERQMINHCHEIIQRFLFSPVKYTRTAKCADFENILINTIETNNYLIRSIVTCADKNITWQADMEDVFAVLDNYGKRENTTFLGLFDGYNGTSAALNVSLELPVLFLSHVKDVDPSYILTEEENNFIDSFDMVFKDRYKETEDNFSSAVQSKMTQGIKFELIHASYAKAFWRMDRILKLGRKENSFSRWSGCTAVTCLIDGLTNIKEGQEKNDTGHPSDDTTHALKCKLGMLHLANLGKHMLCSKSVMVH